MKINTLVPIILVSILISCGKISNYSCTDQDDLPANSFITSDKAKNIGDILCKCLNKEKVPCIQITIIDSLGNIWSVATGTADLKRNKPVTTNNVLRLASITKTFTATVILTLIDQGKLNLDDKLTTYFPEFTEANDVTIKNLLNHSSGIKDLLTLPDIILNSSLFSDKIWDINSIVQTISKKGLSFQTGTDHQYSNTNYVLLGLIAEKITKRKITEIYKEFIFNPLNINKLTLVPQEKSPETLVSGFDRKLLPTAGLYELTPENTAWASAAFTSGALIGNSEQTAIFFSNLLTGKLLSVNSLNNMKDFAEKKDPDNVNQKYFGLGLFKFDINSNIYYGHEGLFVGADNIAAFRIKDKVTIVILANISTFDKFGLLKEIDNEF
ncbi:MAG: serine hydrolase [Bacteroidia bacterium]|nr:serine hydrolase [Bacteroidia bacterium]